jgi:hypothetical protein
LVEIGTVVSEERIFFLIPSPLFSNLQLLKIEISSNGQKLLYFKPESAQI